MSLPPGLQNEGAWIALGMSAMFVVAAFVMHRVFLKILKNPEDASVPSSSHPSESRPHE